MRTDCRKRPLYVQRQEAGLCVRCGAERNLSRCHCDDCVVLVRLKQRKREGCNPRREGGRGRPPLEVKR